MSDKWLALMAISFVFIMMVALTTTEYFDVQKAKAGLEQCAKYGDGGSTIWVKDCKSHTMMFLENKEK